MAEGFLLIFFPECVRNGKYYQSGSRLRVKCQKWWVDIMHFKCRLDSFGPTSLGCAASVLWGGDEHESSLSIFLSFFFSFFLSFFLFCHILIEICII